MDGIGSVIAGKYELIELAGTGGMATVWRAVQRGAAGFERPVAVKRIRPDLAHESEFIDMFVEEARVCAELVHPSIVSIHDFGLDKGLYYLVMEWVQGISLARYVKVRIDQAKLPSWQLLAAVAIEALHGLTAAHERRDASGLLLPIYHRDVTPQNILLSEQGHVKLTDFGLARAMDRARTTHPDIIKGKIGYLAPELTEAGEPSPQTDIYSLGVVLWQGLAGRKLFYGDNDIDVLVKANQAEIPPLEEYRPDVPARFASIIERALARDPSDRFESAAQMTRVIANMLRNVPERTDAPLIARAVSEARRTLGLPSRIPPPPV
jgi:serine/threonine-protein kinase